MGKTDFHIKYLNYLGRYSLSGIIWKFYLKLAISIVTNKRLGNRKIVTRTVNQY